MHYIFEILPSAGGSAPRPPCFWPLVLPQAQTPPKLPLRIPGYAIGSIIGGGGVAQLVERRASD